MILNKDINPEYSLYHVGSYILETLIEMDKKSSFSALYNVVYSKNKTTVNLFSLALDWLYAIDAISLDKNGVIRCS
ncbi:hypothetical protein BSPLISOX_132 [uncultured Gammaproteobacteria bacterium]|jgi:hypothetical protein|nr:hypothetical protein [uncultured Gammaproteobacteria bacterium]VVH58857.1 hypothetical protein BSPCLSOX_600 [uncultured Gammaproteobacteria bacterium]VVH61134.1 hypothetical protein BSPWISOX_1612 [uncultured Gammaproteobacteria bacterium]VVH64742.1 hypothetical protein BSPLISOX_132 [uncultured Gammaproteobacteria bacterium]VVM23212.1 hypothetical protein BSPWISOXPB_814 [uncultured Gammaproteobacteria bacterium]